MTLEKKERLKGSTDMNIEKEGGEGSGCQRAERDTHASHDPGYCSVSSRTSCPPSIDVSSTGTSQAFQRASTSFSTHGFSEAPCHPSKDSQPSRRTDGPHSGSHDSSEAMDCETDSIDSFEKQGCCVHQVDSGFIESLIDCKPSADSRLGKLPELFEKTLSVEPERERKTDCGRICHEVPAANQEVNPEPDTTQDVDYLDQDQEGDTILHIAVILVIQKAVYDVLRMLTPTEICDILRTQNNLFQSPLHLAAITAQHRVARVLTLLGAPLSMRDRNGNTPLHIACKNGDIRTVKALTQPVSQIDREVSCLVEHECREELVDLNVNARNYEGYTSLHLAALRGYVHIVDYLLTQTDCDVNAGDGRSGRTVLHYAVEQQNYALIRYLVANRDKCRLQIDAQSYAGHTPLKLAFGLGLSSVTSLLILLGADGASAESDEDVLLV